MNFSSTRRLDDAGHHVGLQACTRHDARAAAGSRDQLLFALAEERAVQDYEAQMRYYQEIADA